MATSRGERLPSLFSTRDETFHANLRRSVNHAFSMTAMVQYEPMVNETTEIFLDQTEKLFTSDRGDNYNRRNNSNSPEDPDVDQTAVCNFARWLQFFAFDVIGSITYSKRHGFIEKNEDIDGIISQLARIFDYSGPVGQMPWLDCIFWKNPVLMLMSKWGIKDGSSPVAKFAKARMDERRKYDLLDTTADTGSGNGMGKAEILLPDEDSKKEKKQQTTGNLHQRADLLTMFLNAKCQRPEFMTEKEVLTMAVSMAFAGSETTAISLSSVFYFLLKNPICLARLREEIDAAVACGDIQDRPTGLVSWSESQKLPFLDACVKESFRLHPAAGLPLERIVPEPGLEIAGHFVPGGTIVGCSAWVIHRREEIFGPDVDDFRPDRWLRPKRGESESAFAERLKAMNGYMFHFGAGSRTCIGKNISLMEIYKLIPSFFRRFDVSWRNFPHLSGPPPNPFFSFFDRSYFPHISILMMGSHTFIDRYRTRYICVSNLAVG